MARRALSLQEIDEWPGERRVAKRSPKVKTASSSQNGVQRPRAVAAEGIFEWGETNLRGPLNRRGPFGSRGAPIRLAGPLERVKGPRGPFR